jgi:uncharacterized protein YdhG (YjbR/CyaY superfamily)
MREHAASARVTSMSPTSQRSTKRFSDAEQAAMRERAKEQKAAAGRGAGAKVDGETDALAKIADMHSEDRAMAERLHALIKASVPDLTPKTWYGMPAYANKAGEIICFFQPASKFKSRYATLGFSDKANLDDGAMWPTYYALTKLTSDDESRILALIKKAAS